MLIKDLEFYRDKRVLVTGHTGFKGSWLCKMLVKAGAKVYGISLLPNDSDSLYNIAHIDCIVESHICDIRNKSELYKIYDSIKPEIIFHLAAQALVRQSYDDPVFTYETNVNGTINLLECVRLAKCTRSIVIVTTDKVYKNNEWCWGYRENETLNGFDPYSNSKSCAELVTQTYKNCYFKDNIAVSTARAGNVIGGGDFSVDRIVPDCIRAALSDKIIRIRNPFSIRPYQHVLEPLSAYLLIAQKQYQNLEYSSCYNIGPNESDCVNTNQLVDIFIKEWGGDFQKKIQIDENAPHESTFLKLDCSYIKNSIGWKPVWNIDYAINRTVEWTKYWHEGKNIVECMEHQIDEFYKDREK